MKDHVEFWSQTFTIGRELDEALAAAWTQDWNIHTITASGASHTGVHVVWVKRSRR